MADAGSELLIGKLRWRCRRGTRELDVLLSGFLENHYQSLEPDLRSAFQALLDNEDDQLWDWLTGRRPAAEQNLRDIVDVIRRTT